jgi:hypothetical protein
MQITITAMQQYDHLQVQDSPVTHAARALAELNDSASVLPNQSALSRTAPNRLGRPSPPPPC